MARDTAADLASILAASGIGLTVGTNLFLGPAIEDDDAVIPDVSCFILQTGGDPPLTYLGGGRTSYREVTCQVRIRSARESFQAGHLLALAALDALHLASAPPYVKVEVEEGSPNYFDTDGSDRHWWSFTVSAAFVDAGTLGTPIALADTGDREVAGDLLVGGRLTLAGSDVGALVAELLARVAALEARLSAAGL